MLILVYGVFLAVVGVTALVQTMIITAYYSTAVLTSIVDGDAGVVRAFVNEQVTPGDLAGETVTPERAASVTEAIGAFITRHGIVRLEVRTPAGVVVFSDAPVRGQSAAGSSDFLAAAGGAVQAAVVDPDSASEAIGQLPTSSVLREYFPLLRGDEVGGVVGVWRDSTPILRTLGDTRRDIVIVTVSAAVIAAIVLFFVFRGAQDRIRRQTAQLIEATRRDPLTGRLNHGAVVEDLAVVIEHSRAAGTSLGIALLDIDNFRLLNESYGHAAGDEAILRVDAAIEGEARAGALIGRYGPDEFLLVVEDADVGALDDAVERIRAALAGTSLTFGASERLPLTVSAAICAYPVHGTSVIQLLARAAVTLQEAKASGGDTVRQATSDVEQPEARTFDVFQGLIIAVDTKDHYTKRHSEDVARYATFIAQELGLEPRVWETIRVAGLLHDVGKIGIPDAILRKPGRLTAEEYEIVKHHVALGDMIVRDVPDIDTVRAGIRHHHERVDGKGYLHALSGADIPLVARILAVADAFSAMTTSRPYRKALDVREALVRLGDAAGTQLDEGLVEVFIRGVEANPAAPLPGVEPGRLWVPAQSVA